MKISWSEPQSAPSTLEYFHIILNTTLQLTKQNTLSYTPQPKVPHLFPVSTNNKKQHFCNDQKGIKPSVLPSFPLLSLLFFVSLRWVTWVLALFLVHSSLFPTSGLLLFLILLPEISINQRHSIFSSYFPNFAWKSPFSEDHHPSGSKLNHLPL